MFGDSPERLIAAAAYVREHGMVLFNSDEALKLGFADEIA